MSNGADGKDSVAIWMWFKMWFKLECGCLIHVDLPNRYIQIIHYTWSTVESDQTFVPFECPLETMFISWICGLALRLVSSQHAGDYILCWDSATCGRFGNSRTLGQSIHLCTTTKLCAYTPKHGSGFMSIWLYRMLFDVAKPNVM